MSTCDETSVQDVINSKKNSKRPRKKPSRFQDSCTSDSSCDTDKNNNDDEGLGLDSLQKQVILPSFNYDGSDNGTSKNMEAYVDDLLETQELSYGDFFQDHPVYDDLALTKKLSIREISGIEEKKNASMDNDVRIAKSSCQPNEFGETESSNDLENQLASSSAGESNNNLKKINEVNQNSAAAGFTGINKDTTNEVDTSTGQSVTCNSNCCSACRSVLYSVSRKLDTLLNIVGDNPWPNTIRASDVLPNFPICKHEDLVKFNNLLTDKEAARTQYEDFIKQRRHLDGKKCIRIVLGHILSDELSCKLSWSGQKNTIKVEKMPFVKYLRETVTATSRSSLDECKQSIMSWMQHANDGIKKIYKIHA